MEHRDRLFSLTKDADAQPPPARQLPDDVLHRAGRPHPTLIDDADHGAELRQLGEDMARDYPPLCPFLKVFSKLSQLNTRSRILSPFMVVYDKCSWMLFTYQPG